MQYKRGKPTQAEGEKHLDAAHRAQPRRLHPRDHPRQNKKHTEGFP